MEDYKFTAKPEEGLKDQVKNVSESFEKEECQESVNKLTLYSKNIE